MRNWRLGVAAALLAFGLAAHAGTRITSTSLTYLGRINITHSDGSCAESPNARSLGLALDPAGNGGAGSFYITHRWSSDCVAEITKPAVGGTATYIQNFTSVLGGSSALNSVDDSCPSGSTGCYVGGLLIHGGNLYVTAFSDYDNTPNQSVSIWRRSKTLSSSAGRVGPLASAGSGNQGFMAQYMDLIPAAHQAALGGEALIGACCNSVITRTSLGPALYSFNPASLGTGFALVQYPDGHQTLNTWGAAGSHPEANPTTRIAGVTFIDGTDSVLFIGNTGTGEYCYGTGCTDPDAPGVQGTHAYPYVHYVWAYDVDDLAAAKAGSVQPWDVVPYAMWALPDMGNVSYGDQWSTTGAAYDDVAQRLYVLKSRETDGSAWPQIHVYSVDTGGSGLLPGPDNFRRIPK